MVAQWPTNPATAESFLVRQEADQALILNPLRVQPDVRRYLEFPMTCTELPMMQAIYGVRGIIEGIDFGGVSVFADVRDVLGAPWFMVSKMDTREALASLHRSHVYRERYQAARAARELNRHNQLNAIPDSLMVTDLDSRIQSVNAAFTRINRYSEAEALGKTPRLLRWPDQDPKVYVAMPAELAEVGGRLEPGHLEP